MRQNREYGNSYGYVEIYYKMNMIFQIKEEMLGCLIDSVKCGLKYEGKIKCVVL